MDWAIFVKLQDVADDFELDTLTNLAQRAGLLWECESCELLNGIDEDCVSCGLGPTDTAHSFD